MAQLEPTRTHELQPEYAACRHAFRPRCGVLSEFETTRQNADISSKVVTNFKTALCAAVTEIAEESASAADGI